jgi:hypothetical protein
LGFLLCFVFFGFAVCRYFTVFPEETHKNIVLRAFFLAILRLRGILRARTHVQSNIRAHLALISNAVFRLRGVRPISLRKEMGERTAKGGDPPLETPSKGGRGRRPFR